MIANVAFAFGNSPKSVTRSLTLSDTAASTERSLFGPKLVDPQIRVRLRRLQLYALLVSMALDGTHDLLYVHEGRNGVRVALASSCVTIITSHRTAVCLRGRDEVATAVERPAREPFL